MKTVWINDISRVKSRFGKEYGFLIYGFANVLPQKYGAYQKSSILKFRVVFIGIASLVSTLVGKVGLKHRPRKNNGCGLVTDLLSA